MDKVMVCVVVARGVAVMETERVAVKVPVGIIVPVGTGVPVQLEVGVNEAVIETLGVKV